MNYRRLLGNVGLFVSLSYLPSARAEVNTAPPTDILRGKVRSLDHDVLRLSTQAGIMTVKILSPLTVYGSHTASLSDVKSSSFIGVSSVKQSDGSQRATEVHIFPEAIRGLGEGSYMMAPASGASSASRMTNGQVAVAKASPASRMTNGVVKANGRDRKLTVDFKGGQQVVTVPPDVPVTEIAPVNKTLAPGDTVVLQVKKASDGALSTSMVMLRNASSN
jgi:hypothetical protein